MLTNNCHRSNAFGNLKIAGGKLGSEWNCNKKMDNKLSSYFLLIKPIGKIRW